VALAWPPDTAAAALTKAAVMAVLLMELVSAAVMAVPLIASTAPTTRVMAATTGGTSVTQKKD